jgi:hypothetical protein
MKPDGGAAAKAHGGAAGGAAARPDGGAATKPHFENRGRGVGAAAPAPYG